MTDMSAYRKSVIDAIKRLGEDRYIVDALETMPATEENEIDAIRQHIRESDLFIGMYGFRYGFVPKGLDQSVTEFEYREAMAGNKPIVTLLMADDAPLSAKDIDRGPAAARIDGFRAELATNHVVGFFKTPEEAAAASTTALGRLSGSVQTRQLSSQPQPAIFISYRRQDTQDVVSRLYDQLIARFGHDNVFMDMSSIPLGVDFRQILVDAIHRSSAMLVVIGADWLGAESREGVRRLDVPNDFIRLEVETALQAKLAVIPLVVDDARMPDSSELPDSLSELALQNAIRIRRGAEFRTDMDHLVYAIQQSALTIR